jgi:multiple sugar transport system permease protein
MRRESNKSAEGIPLRERWEALGFLFPVLLFIGALVLVPVLGTLLDSLYRDVTFLPRSFIGLENYRALFADPSFWMSLSFTLVFVLVSVPLQTILGLLIALVLNESFAGRGMLRACVLIPWAVPAAVSGRVFELIYNYSYGGANWLLGHLYPGAGPVNWLGTELGALAAVVVADTWKTTPFAALLLLAGLSAIPGDLYRQALIDRATFLQRFVRITLPLLKPVLVVTLIFRTIDALRVFDVIFVLTGGGPGGATSALSIYGFRYYAAGDFGYASAVSVLLFLIALILVVGYARLGGFGREVR